MKKPYKEPLFTNLQIGRIDIDLCLDFNYFAILPAININGYSKAIEFEWLYFAMYIDIK